VHNFTETFTSATFLVKQWTGSFDEVPPFHVNELFSQASAETAAAKKMSLNILQSIQVSHCLIEAKITQKLFSHRKTLDTPVGNRCR